MIRETALLTGIAGAFLFAAPALAQDPATTQTPEPAAAEPQSVTLQPGATVRGSDGSTLGTLVGAQNNASGQQELTVRGSDGQVRGVPLAGLTQEGSDVVVGWTSAEFNAAAPIAGEEEAAPAPAEPVEPDATPEPVDPAFPADASEPLTPDEPSEPEA